VIFVSSCLHAGYCIHEGEKRKRISCLQAAALIRGIRNKTRCSEKWAKRCQTLHTGVASQKNWIYRAGIVSQRNWIYRAGIVSQKNWIYRAGIVSQRNWIYRAGIVSQRNWIYRAAQGSGGQGYSCCSTAHTTASTVRCSRAPCFMPFLIYPNHHIYQH
jgi:hypothetical protein